MDQATTVATKRVVISERFGGFGLSTKAQTRLRELGWSPTSQWDDGGELARDDPRLVAVVAELGDEANDQYSNLVVVDVPEGVQWHVHEYDGFEEIHETHRVWNSRGETRDCT